MTTNRIAQHLAAITPPDPLPEIPKPEPARGYDHFAVGVFNPRKVNWKTKWIAKHIEDAPSVGLDYDDLDWRGRFSPSAIAVALRWVKAFNEPRFANSPFGDEWAMLAFVDGGCESVKLDYCRCVSPFRYCTHEVITPPRWQPASLFDTPAELLTDEMCSLFRHEHATLDAAVLAAAKANRKFRPGKRKKNGWPQRWTLVLAVECDASTSHDSLNYQGRIGNFTETKTRRFHLVDASWPLAPETLATVMIGGER
jgi:hypothetical protein